jgi:hypothetical protein
MSGDSGPAKRRLKSNDARKALHALDALARPIEIRAGYRRVDRSLWGVKPPASLRSARRERPNWGPALLMRPAEAAPVVPFVTLPLHWNPNACASDYRGVSDPVVPFKPPCLTTFKLGSGGTVARGAYNFLAACRPAARPAAVADFPVRLQTRPPRVLRNRSRHGDRHRVRPGNQKSSVMNPQSATPPSIIDHSEGVSPNSLPSLITYVIIGWYLVLTRRTLASAGSKGCSARVTDRLNLARRCRRGRGSSDRLVTRSSHCTADHHFARVEQWHFRDAFFFSKIAQAARVGATQIRVKDNNVRRSPMTHPMKIIVAPALAGSLLLMTGFDPAKAATRHHASSEHSRSAATRSFNAVPDTPRSPRLDYRYGTSAHPYGPGVNFPYPDRPYGDPDHW